MKGQLLPKSILICLVAMPRATAISRTDLLQKIESQKSFSFFDPMANQQRIKAQYGTIFTALSDKQSQCITKGNTLAAKLNLYLEKDRLIDMLSEFNNELYETATIERSTPATPAQRNTIAKHMESLKRQANTIKNVAERRFNTKKNIKDQDVRAFLDIVNLTVKTMLASYENLEKEYKAL